VKNTRRTGSKQALNWRQIHDAADFTDKAKGRRLVCYASLFLELGAAVPRHSMHARLKSLRHILRSHTPRNLGTATPRYAEIEREPICAEFARLIRVLGGRPAQNSLRHVTAGNQVPRIRSIKIGFVLPKLSGLVRTAPND
jgi:hypothetical protein